MIPWTCDALLPTAERYASPKFRRFARHFSAASTDYVDAVELVAFLELVPVLSARWIFHWGGTGQREARALIAHLRDCDDVKAMAEANVGAVTRADGLACLAAMRDGGWTKGPVPPMVRAAILDMRDYGMSRVEVGSELGLTLDQVRIMGSGHRKKNHEIGGAGLGATLVAG